MKILKIVANGYKRCEKDLTISFLPQAPKTSEDREFELTEIDDDLFVFSTLGIVGKNASGKTTTAELLGLVYDIFTSFQISSRKEIFLSKDSTISLDVTFYHDGTIYRYLTELYKDISSNVADSIFFKNEQLYKRVYRKTHSRNLFEYNKYEKMEIPDLPKNTSALYNVLKDINLRGMYFPSNDFMQTQFAYSFDVFSILKKLGIDVLTSVIRLFDNHIEKIEMLSKDKFKIFFTDKTSREVSDTQIPDILSSGTLKGIYLYGYVIYSLIIGCDVVIDEIENHFHKTLVEFLINLYKDKTVNKNNATLIFTTHYPEILELFNRFDNILISKYDKNIKLENAFTDYKIRSDLSKSKLFYKNAFNTNVDYDKLMDIKKELM